MTPAVDHLVYAAPALDPAVAALERLLGVRASPGGHHLGEGTHNALIGLGPGSYLEILAPDPGQPRPPRPLWLGVDGLTTPRLVTWAAKSDRLDDLVARAREIGVPLGRVRSGSRHRPDGTTLNWRFTDPHALSADGIVPFFIDWGSTPHPAGSVAPGVSLVSLRGEHPDGDRIAAQLLRLGVGLDVRLGPRPALIATIQTPRGRIELT